MKTPITLKQFVINNLRKASWKWPYKNACKKKAKIARNQYVCNQCKLIFPNKEVKVDHKVPVIDPLIGWVDFNTFIERLLCQEDNFQVLCNNCHNLKTVNENAIRRMVKLDKKNQNR